MNPLADFWERLLSYIALAMQISVKRCYISKFFLKKFLSLKNFVEPDGDTRCVIFYIAFDKDF